MNAARPRAEGSADMEMTRFKEPDACEPRRGLGTKTDQAGTGGDDSLFERLAAALQRASGGVGRITVAYSGGLDSRFLSFCAAKKGYGVRLLHVAGAHIAPEETAEAVALAQAMNLSAEVVRLPLASPQELARAGRQRCYVCKKAIFSQLKAMAEGGRLCDGTNASDLDVFRPGSRAVTELGVFSPLAEAGFTKPMIRQWAARLGLPLPEQSARPCLLTRFPYGVEPGARELSTVGEVEQWLADSPLGHGLAFRLRYPDGLHPVLHVAREGLYRREEAFGKNEASLLAEIRTALVGHFGRRLAGLEVAAMDVLSGYYDREQLSRPKEPEAVTNSKGAANG